MQNQESRLPPALFILGGALILIGKQISLSALMNLGLICIGLATIAVGIEMLVTGRAIFRTNESWGAAHYQRFFGLTARMWGVAFLVFGGFVCLVTIIGWFLPGGSEELWARFLSTPPGWGILLLGVGAAAMNYGIIHIIAGTALLGSGVGASVSNLLARIWGMLVLLIGLGFAMLGLLLIVVPDILLTPIDHVLQSIPTPPIPPKR